MDSETIEEVAIIGGIRGRKIRGRMLLVEVISSSSVSTGMKQIQVAGECLGGDLSSLYTAGKGLHSVGMIFK